MKDNRKQEKGQVKGGSRKEGREGKEGKERRKVVVGMKREEKRREERDERRRERESTSQRERLVTDRERCLTSADRERKRLGGGVK
jgi:hypothetical protein